ncbi:hypothetical protein L209DRAFT_140668 [Thermothelomyces heterothallicus CBS 203.75]
MSSEKNSRVLFSFWNEVNDNEESQALCNWLLGETLRCASFWWKCICTMGAWGCPTSGKTELGRCACGSMFQGLNLRVLLSPAASVLYIDESTVHTPTHLPQNCSNSYSHITRHSRLDAQHLRLPQSRLGRRSGRATAARNISTALRSRLRDEHS